MINKGLIFSDFREGGGKPKKNTIFQKFSTCSHLFKNIRNFVSFYRCCLGNNMKKERMSFSFRELNPKPNNIRFCLLLSCAIYLHKFEFQLSDCFVLSEIFGKYPRKAFLYIQNCYHYTYFITESIIYWFKEIKDLFSFGFGKCRWELFIMKMSAVDLLPFLKRKIILSIFLVSMKRHLI